MFGMCQSGGFFAGSLDFVDGAFDQAVVEIAASSAEDAGALTRGEVLGGELAVIVQDHGEPHDGVVLGDRAPV